MSTRHVILGLLREKPGHTYDIAVRFGERLSPWRMNRGQVYSMVSALESKGLIESIGVQDEDVRSGPPWQLTATGSKELERWLATPSDDVEPLRGALLAKFAIAVPADAAKLLISLDWYERALVTEIAADIHRRQENATTATEEWSRQVADCIADGAILHRDAELIWIRRMREVVQGWATQTGAVERPAELRYARGR